MERKSKDYKKGEKEKQGRERVFGGVVVVKGWVRVERTKEGDYAWRIQ
jgi:hypothetical protein